MALDDGMWQCIRAYSSERAGALGLWGCNQAYLHKARCLPAWAYFQKEAIPDLLVFVGLQSNLTSLGKVSRSVCIVYLHICTLSVEQTELKHSRRAPFSSFPPSRRKPRSWRLLPALSGSGGSPAARGAFRPSVGSAQTWARRVRSRSASLGTLRLQCGVCDRKNKTQKQEALADYRYTWIFMSLITLIDVFNQIGSKTPLDTVSKWKMAACCVFSFLFELLIVFCKSLCSLW